MALFTPCEGGFDPTVVDFWAWGANFFLGLTVAQSNSVILFDSLANNNGIVILPDNNQQAFDIGTFIFFVTSNNGPTGATLSPNPGVTITGLGATTFGQRESYLLTKTAINTWNFVGVATPLPVV